MIYYHVRAFEIILLNKSLYEDFGETGSNVGLRDVGGRNVRTTHKKMPGGGKKNLRCDSAIFFFLLFTLEKSFKHSQ